MNLVASVTLALTLTFLSTSYADVMRPLEVLQDQILSLIETECDSMSDCKTVGIGYKACGGPRTYEVYSTKATDEPKLLEKVNILNQLERQTSTNSFSDCAVVLPPAVACIDHQCVKKQ